MKIICTQVQFIGQINSLLYDKLYGAFIIYYKKRKGLFAYFQVSLRNQ